MRVTVLVDNLCCRNGLRAEWGYAACLETREGVLLLDTGASGAILLHNMDALGLAPEAVTDICLSHGHFDHTGGLSDVLRRAPGARIWAAVGLDRERRSGRAPIPERINGGGPQLRLIGLRPVDDATVLLPGITAFCVPQARRDPAWTCRGELWERADDGTFRPDTFADDVSLLVQGMHGPSLLLGCAHAGLPNILDYVRERFGVDELYAVIGGTHLSIVPEERLPGWIARLSGFRVRRWRPNHCTGFRAAALLAAACPDTEWCGAGSRLDL